MRLFVLVTPVLCAAFVASAATAAGPFDATFNVIPVTGHHAVGVVAGDFGGSPSPDLVAITSEGNALYLGGKGNGSFFPAQQIPLSGRGYHIMRGDLDGDGRLDVVVATPAGLTVLFGPGPSFTRVDLSGPASHYVAVGDYDGDGLWDVAAVSDSGIQVYRHSAPRAFVRALSIAQSSRTIGMGDFNEDGYADIVCETGDPNLPLALYRSDGLGGFLPALTFAGSRYYEGQVTSLAVGDLNADGHLDVAMTAPNDGPIAFYGHGNTGFSARAVHSTLTSAGRNQTQEGPENAQVVAIADIDDRGANELLLGYADNGWGSTLAVGSAGLATLFSPQSIAVADLNIDGAPDVIVAGADLAIYLATAPGSFRPLASFPTDEYPRTGRLIDLDGDGRNDLVIENSTSFVVFKNMGGSSFQPAAGLGWSGLFGIADFNGDGRLDFFDGSARLYLATGSFQYSEGSPLADYYADGLAVADFNGDGNPDACLPFSYPTPVTLMWLGHGDGTFASPISLPLRHGTLDTADMNNDGVPDLVVCTQDSVFVYCGLGDGTFAPALSRSAPGVYYGNYPVLGDFNGDGFVDLWSAAGAVLFGNGDGTLHTPISQPDVPGTGIRRMATMDIDGDGRTDLVAAGFENDFFVWRSHGDGTFELLGGYSATAGASAVIPGNVDGDGRQDVVVAGEASNETPGQSRAAVFLNRGVTPVQVSPPTHTVVAPALRISPSPATSATTIRFELTAAAPVELDVLDVTGRLIGRMPRATYTAGAHQVAWSTVARGVQAPGIYYVRARLGASTRCAAIVVIR